MTEITEPGVYQLDDATYHGDPVPERLGGSLSASGARRLLPPHTPARFAYDRAHPPKPTAAFDLGHAAHRTVLGTGPDLKATDADDWRSKAAREFRDACHAEGTVPLLARELQQVFDMAAAIRRHPVASRLFEPFKGTPEQSLFWQDHPDKPWRRARLDWLPQPKGGRLIVPDYKTARTANPALFGKAAADYGYPMQAAWYLDAVAALGLADDAAFVFVLQEKDPPYLVSVVELDAEALAIGRAMNARALDVYAECVGTGLWPGYSAEVELASLPYWFVKQQEEVMP